MPTDLYNWDKCLQHSSGTDVGLRRANNQDCYAVQLAADRERWRRYGHLFIIADGMGAHAAGELASKLAVDHVPLLYYKQDELSPPEAIATALQGANQEIFRRGQENLDFHNMGTTCSALLLLPQGAVVGHVGDSRIYRLRGDEFCQLTFDHSLDWEMRSTSQLDDDDTSLPGIPKNVITRSLGPHPNVQVDLEGPFPIEVGDTFLLCSDGLTGPLTNRDIATVLRVMEPDDASQMLIDLANMHGGPDNITVVIAKVIGPELATGNQAESPLTIGGNDPPRHNVHPAIWVALCVCALCAAVLLATDRPLAAAITFGISVVGSLAACAHKWELFRSSGLRLSEENRLGNGPYRRTADFSAADFCIKLADKLRTAKDTVDARDWDIDWTKFNQDQQAAADLVAQQPAGGSVANLCEGGSRNCQSSPPTNGFHDLRFSEITEIMSLPWNGLPRTTRC